MKVVTSSFNHSLLHSPIIYIHVYIYFCTRLNVGTVTHCCAEVGIETKQKTKTKNREGEKTHAENKQHLKKTFDSRN